MIKKIQQYYLFWGLLLFSLGAYAQSQNYPITGAGSFIPQNSLSWFSLYTSPALNFNLYLKDASSTPGAIFARMRLSRVGIEIYNPASFVGTKGFTVNFGQPLQLTGMDLVENFRPQNLEASGVSENLFTQGGVLPNGIWTLELVFYEQDPARNYRQVSDKITVSFTVTNGQAPLLNLPSNESEIDARYGQNIGFAWTPRGTSLSGAGGLTYNFTLWELGEDENPYDVAEGKTPIYTSSVSVPMLAYDPTKPLLQVGKHYAWQVQVVDPFGNNVYENNGKSEIWEFRYGLKCDAPALNFKSVGAGYTEIYWDKINQAQNYDLRWRIQGTTEYSHYLTSGTYHRIAFDKNRVYEVELQSQCYGGENSDWESSNYPQASPMMLRTMSVTTSGTESSATPNTPINPADILVNGADVNAVKYDSLITKLQEAPQTLLPRCGQVTKTLVSSCEPETTVDYGGTEPFVSKVGSTFYVNGYDVLITRVKSHNEGEGLLYFPLARNRIPVVWKGVTLTDSKIYDYMGNSYGCLTSGEVLVVGSNPNLMGSDLTKQYNALYNSLNSPGSYSGTFGEALDSLKIKSELLQDAKNRTKANIESLVSVTKAVKTGFKALEKTFLDTYKSADNFPQIAKDLLALKPDSTNPNQVLNRLQACVAPNSSSTGGKKQVLVNLYRLKLADCLDDSNILQETQDYAGNIQTLLTEFSEYETLLSGTKLICGCTDQGDIVPTWADILTWDRDCKQLIIYLEGLKKSISTNKSIQNYPRGVSAIGQIKIGDVCIDKVYIHTQESPSFEVLLPSKKKTTMGVEFDISNSTNKYKIDIQDTEAKDVKIDAVWKYLGGSFSTLDLLKHESGREYGWLSSSQESDGDACIIGYDNAGGCSYGLYQLAVKTGKFEAYKEYVNDNYRSYWGQYAEIFKDDDIESAKEANSKRECQSLALTVAFNKVCNDDKFIALSQRTIATQNYKPVYDKIINTFGQTSLFNDMDASEEEALKEMCYSLGVQHGKAWRIFQMALLNDYTDCSYQSQTSDFSPSTCNSVRMSDFPPMSGADATKLASMKSTANSISMTDFKNRLYAARKLYVSIVNAPGWGNMVKSDGRYEKEKKLLSRKTNI